MKTKPKLKSTQANKLLKEARAKILGPGLKARIKKNAAKPYINRGNFGIYWDPNWQDGVLDMPNKEYAPGYLARLIEEAAKIRKLREKAKH
jgi:hypothetical protein